MYLPPLSGPPSGQEALVMCLDRSRPGANHAKKKQWFRIYYLVPLYSFSRPFIQNNM